MGWSSGGMQRLFLSAKGLAKKRRFRGGNGVGGGNRQDLAGHGSGSGRRRHGSSGRRREFLPFGAGLDVALLDGADFTVVAVMVVVAAGEGDHGRDSGSEGKDVFHVHNLLLLRVEH